MRYARSSDVSEKRVGSELALYVSATRAIHVLNPTSRLIWESLREPLTFDELLFVLDESFDADPAVLASDLRTTLEQFRDLGLIGARPSA